MTACPLPCPCQTTTVPLPCDRHDTVTSGCTRCRRAVPAVVVDLGCTTHIAAVTWAASGLTHSLPA
jgi:hypothetical protein